MSDNGSNFHPDKIDTANFAGDNMDIDNVNKHVVVPTMHKYKYDIDLSIDNMGQYDIDLSGDNSKAAACEMVTNSFEMDSSNGQQGRGSFNMVATGKTNVADI